MAHERTWRFFPDGYRMESRVITARRDGTPFEVRVGAYENRRSEGASPTAEDDARFRAALPEFLTRFGAASFQALADKVTTEGRSENALDPTAWPRFLAVAPTVDQGGNRTSRQRWSVRRISAAADSELLFICRREIRRTSDFQPRDSSLDRFLLRLGGQGTLLSWDSSVEKNIPHSDPDQAPTPAGADDRIKFDAILREVLPGLP